MTIVDAPPPNTARVLLDGDLLVNKTKVPVLISAGNHRLVVLQSQALYDIKVGDSGLLVSEARGQQEVLISDIDRLAMVVRYELSSPPANDDDFELPSPE
ncbi:MAG TPA: hypothetical protein DEF47_22900 [Herpetosiphon sp.]|uniref:hypothetical protein n=1 Tax=Herpetosiphon sp. TaxID=71864 RepID=UPI00059C3658|nr:hypothetical protein [Herpetosiphon sp.]MCA0355189.1 hypothetical protein [Chloroflexota bacterium]HBW52740.1 hypothetical protein [Herpetosiphon sp.]